MHDCPICGTAIETNPRYPNEVCADCIQRATTPEGVAVQFFNSSLSGGLEVHSGDEVLAQDVLDFVCLIDGLECRAQEAYMGGITVSPV